MPSQLEIDLSTLTEPDGVIRAGDIELPANVTRLTDVDYVIVRIDLPRVEVEVEAGAEAVEEEAAEEATPE